MQETKLADSAAPVAEFRDAGYELAHHGEGQWNGVAIASRVGIADVAYAARHSPTTPGRACGWARGLGP